MGHSFLNYRENTLRIRDGTLGFLCAILADEFEQLEKAEGKQEEVLMALITEIKTRALFEGYTTVLDLTHIVKTEEDRDHFVRFIQYVQKRISALESPLPSTYLKTLPGGYGCAPEVWTVKELNLLLSQVGELIKQA